MKPTTEEMAAALSEARRMREQGDDACFLAKALLNLDYRQHHYESLVQAVERYLHSGQAEQAHTHLLKTLEDVRHMDERTAGREHEDLGLG